MDCPRIYLECLSVQRFRDLISEIFYARHAPCRSYMRLSSILICIFDHLCDQLLMLGHNQFDRRPVYIVQLRRFIVFITKGP